MLGKRVLEWQLKRKLKRRNPYRGINSRHTAAILLQLNGKSELKCVSEFAGKLRNNGQSVDLCAFYPGKEKNLKGKYHEPDFPVLTKSSINWLGLPKGPEVKTFFSKEYDLLYNLDLKCNDYLHYLAAGAHARFKIGFDLNRAEIYDFMVDLPENADVKKAIQTCENTLRDVFGNGTD